MVIKIFWSDEDEMFVAIDTKRKGCSALASTELFAVQSLVKNARPAWDQAAKRAGNPIPDSH